MGCTVLLYGYGSIVAKKEKEISVKDCIWKYVKRMVLALIIFGIPYVLLMIYFDTRTISIYMIPESIIRVINGESFGHLWYLYTLIGIYLFLPFIKIFVNNAPKQVFQYVFILLFIFNFYFPFIDKICGTNIAFELPMTAWPIFYLLMGHVLFNCDRDKTKAWVEGLLIIITVIVVIVANIATNVSLALMSYNTSINVICSVSIFSLCMRIEKLSTDKLWRVDRLCFGVYLIHPLFIQFCYKFLQITPTGNKLYPVLSIVFAVVFVVIAFIALWIMSLIKPLKKYVL